MDTLLAFTNSAALVGDYSGKTHTELRKDDETIEDWRKRLQQDFQMPGWTTTGEDYVPFPRVAGLYETEDPNVHILRWEDEPIPIKPYEDTDKELTAEAAFDASISMWVVVRRPSKNS